MANNGSLEILDLDKIAECARDLNALAPDTEQEFLHIGNVLNSLASICYGMTDDAVTLSSLAKFRVDKNEANDSSLEESAKIFKTVTNHVEATLTSLGEGEELLTMLLTRIKELHRPINKLHSVGKTFRVLGVEIKVESARTQGMHGFVLLAEEVTDIAKLVQENCRYCIDKADLIEKDISVSQQVLNSSENSYDNSGEQAIYNTLQLLEDIGVKADRLAAGIQERSAAMVQGISDVVMAMQFHDITRQQLENVSAALTETIHKAAAITSLEPAEASDQVVLEVYSILSIQVAHLNSIYEQVRGARKQIETGLEKTMGQAKVQAKDARTLLEMESQNSNKSVVQDLEREIDNIVTSLNNSLKVVEHAAEVSRGVYNNVLEIGSFVNNIEEIAFDVKILAINAMVEALKAETTGSALNVLAKELSNLSQETKDEATDSIKMLESIVEGTEKQLEFSENLDKKSVVVDGMIDKAKEFTGTILTSLQKVSTIGLEMDNSSQDLSARITKLIPGIKFPGILGDRIDQNWQIICGTINQIEDAYPQFREGSPEVKQMLEKLSQQYVMERERFIHSQVAGGETDDASSGDIDLFDDDGFELFDTETPGSPHETTSGENPKKEEFDDNVELF